MRIHRPTLVGGPADGEKRTVVIGQDDLYLHYPPELEAALNASIRVAKGELVPVPGRRAHYQYDRKTNEMRFKGWIS